MRGHYEIGLGRDHFLFDVPTSKEPFEAASNESIFDWLGIFSDASDLKNTLVPFSFCPISANKGSHKKIDDDSLFASSSFFPGSILVSCIRAGATPLIVTPDMA